MSRLIAASEEGASLSEQELHRCIGAPLAKLELETAYTTLFRRMPALRPAVQETDLEWKAGLLTVGPTTLPVTW